MDMSKFAPKPDAKLLVETLLDAAHLKYNIIFEAYKVNHLPHALCALYNMGATAAQIQSYHDVYLTITPLEPLRAPKFTIDETNWISHIPNMDAYPEFLEFFDKQIASLGIQKSIEKFLPLLMTQLHTDVFHPLIHIGYGVEYGLASVLSEGFAYACIRAGKTGELIDRLPDHTSIEGSRFLNILEELKQVHITLPDTYFQFQDMLATHEDVIKSVLLRWKCDKASEQKACLDELTFVAILIFFGSYRSPEPTMDFFLVHGLSGIHAVRAIFPYLPVSEKTRLLRIFVMCLIGTYWCQGSPEFSEATIMAYPFKNHDWDVMLTHALAYSDIDEHVPKVVQALYALKQESGLDPSISSKLLDHSANMIVDLSMAGSIFHLRGIVTKQ